MSQEEFTTEETKDQSEFGKVLDNDPTMNIIKDELEVAKTSLIDINVRAISRMIELMDLEEDQEGRSDHEDELPLLVHSLTSGLLEELCLRTMDIMNPGWEVRAKERIMEMQIREMVEELLGGKGNNLAELFG